MDHDTRSVLFREIMSVLEAYDSLCTDNEKERVLIASRLIDKLEQNKKLYIGYVPNFSNIN